MVKILIVFCLLFCGCDTPTPDDYRAKRGQLELKPYNENTNNYLTDVVSIYYAYDPQTKLCFAYMREVDKGPALTNVPCEALVDRGFPIDSLPTIKSK